MSKVTKVAVRLLDLHSLWDHDHDFCKSRTPDNKWRCTRKNGHEGFHVAAFGPDHLCPDPVWED